MQFSRLLFVLSLIVHTRSVLRLLPTDERFYHFFEGSSLAISCEESSNITSADTPVVGRAMLPKIAPGQWLLLNISRTISGSSVECVEEGSMVDRVTSPPITVYYLEKKTEELSVSLRYNQTLDCRNAFQSSDETNLILSYSWYRHAMIEIEQSTDPVIALSWRPQTPLHERVTCSVTATLRPNNATKVYTFVYNVRWTGYYEFVQLVVGILGPLEIIAIGSAIIILCVKLVCRPSKRSNKTKPSNLWTFNDVEQDRQQGITSRPVRVLPRADPTSVQLIKNSTRLLDYEFPAPPPIEMLQNLNKVPEGIQARLKVSGYTEGNNSQGQMSIRSLRTASSRNNGSTRAAVPAKVPSLLRTAFPIESGDSTTLAMKADDDSNNYASISENECLPSHLSAVDNRAYMLLDERMERDSHIYTDPMDPGNATSSH